MTAIRMLRRSAKAQSQIKPDAGARGLALTPDVALIRKERRCLMCGGQFSSEGAGERICRQCKTRPAWRSGMKWPSGGRPS